MLKLLLQEYQEMLTFLKDHYQAILVLGLSTFSLVMQWYRPFGPSQAVSQLFYYFILPVLAIIFFLKKNPLDYGLRIGSYRIWLWYVIITIIIGLPILVIASRLPSVNKYYISQFDYYEFLTASLPVLFAWEYLLRGFLLFGLKKRFGQMSIVIQMVPFVLLHLGKPEAETLSCILTGLWFGWVAYRGKSFWPAFIIHVFINFTVKYLVNL